MTSNREWSDDEIAALREAFGDALDRQVMEDALLTPDEKAALHEQLARLANERRRVEAENRGRSLG